MDAFAYDDDRSLVPESLQTVILGLRVLAPSHDRNLPPPLDRLDVQPAEFREAFRALLGLEPHRKYNSSQFEWLVQFAR
jgi:hypothetical protein